MASFVIIAYDITDDKRRLALARELLNFGYRVQYSVFEALLEPSEIRALQSVVLGIINEEEDSVRIYVLPLGLKDRVITLGAQREYQEPDAFVF